MKSIRSITPNIKIIRESPVLRIGFSGCQGSGKTTLAEYVIQKYGFKYHIINQSRQVIMSLYKGSLELARQDNFEFQQNLINKKIYLENRYAKYGFVTDRTTIDNVAYFLAYNPSIKTEEVIKYINKGVVHAKKAYDLIFSLTPLLETGDDPLSPPDTIEKFKVFYIVQGLLALIQTHNYDLVKYIYVTDNEARKVLIDNEIEKKLRLF